MATPWSWSAGVPFEESPDPSKASRTWSRKLWGGEMVFAHAALIEPGRGDGLISAVFEASPEHPLERQHIRLTMRNLRFSHPSIATKVIWPDMPDPTEARFVYESPASEEDAMAWVDENTTLVRTAEESGVNSAMDALRLDLGRADFDRTEDQLRQYYIIPSAAKPRVHGILFYLKHSLFDAGAAWNVLDAWLQELAGVMSTSSKVAAPLEWGTEISRLARPVSDRTDNPWSPADLHGEWPLVKRMHKVLERPSVSPFPSQPDR